MPPFYPGREIPSFTGSPVKVAPTHGPIDSSDYYGQFLCSPYTTVTRASKRQTDTWFKKYRLLEQFNKIAVDTTKVADITCKS